MFSCTECGMNYSKWIGKCGACGNWNTIIEESGDAAETTAFFGKQKKSSSKKSGTKSLALVDINEVSISKEERIMSEISEFDRVLGGGLVRGSAILISGDPGIGKSTLLLHCVHNLSKNYQCVYITGEESVSQVSMRHSRLTSGGVNFKIASSGCVEKIISTIDALDQIDCLIIDSIQTMYLEALESAPGTISQIKAATYELMNYCKSRDIIMVLVGHVTKDGQVAGPKVLEHMIDVMLYFDGDNNNHFRILRAIKNRFGATNEIGVFQMLDSGLKCVSNTSEIFLSSVNEDVQGRVSCAILEGTRPILFEIESLTTHTFVPNPRRTTIGWDVNRLNMLLAILTANCGLNFSDKDVYLSILGGMKANDPGVDLAVCISLYSAVKNVKLQPKIIAIGEVSLSGNIRNVFQIDKKINEAIKLGFTTIILPKQKDKIKLESGIEIIEIAKVEEIRKLVMFNS